MRGAPVETYNSFAMLMTWTTASSVRVQTGPMLSPRKMPLETMHVSHDVTQVQMRLPKLLRLPDPHRQKVVCLLLQLGGVPRATTKQLLRVVMSMLTLMTCQNRLLYWVNFDLDFFLDQCNCSEHVSTSPQHLHRHAA